jgi:hypothetical protein
MTSSKVRPLSVHEHAVRSLAVMMALGVGQDGGAAPTAGLRAGVARVDISDRTGLVHDPCHARALVLESGTTRAVIIGVDAVAIGGIGRIDDAFLPLFRTRLQADLGMGYKDVAVAPDAEPLGLRLGVDVLRGMRGLEPRPTDDLRVASSRLEIKAFVAGYTNGSILYAPTSAQRGNTGYAQEDCDCALGPRWQALFEPRAVGLLRDLVAGEAGR